MGQMGKHWMRQFDNHFCVLCRVSVLIVWFRFSVFHLYVSVLFLLFFLCLFSVFLYGPEIKRLIY